MNETNTTGASEGSLDLFANDDASQNPSAQVGDDRGTSNEPNETQSPKGDNEKADEVANSDVDQSKTKDPISAKNPPKEKILTRGDKRTQEIKALVSENKKILEEIRREREQNSRQSANPNQAQAPQEPIFVEQPKKPARTREEIEKAYQAAKDSGNQAGMESALREYAEHDKYDQDMRFWKIENQQKVEKFTEARKANWDKAVKAVSHIGDLTDPNSDVRKLAEQIARDRPYLAHDLRGDGELMIAKVAGTYVENKRLKSELAASKEQIKTLTDKLNAEQNKMQPIRQGATPKAAEPGEGSTPLERLERRLAA